MKANTIGNKTVQQKDINWSKRILGNEALTHINTKTIIALLTPKVNPDRSPSIEGFVSNFLILKYSNDIIQSMSNT